MLNLVALVAKTGSKIDLLGRANFSFAVARWAARHQKLKDRISTRANPKKAGIPAVDEMELHLLQFS